MSMFNSKQRGGFITFIILTAFPLTGRALEPATIQAKEAIEMPPAPPSESMPPVARLPVTIQATVAQPNPVAPIEKSAAKASEASSEASIETLNLNDSEEQRRAYAIGVALAHYIQDNISSEKAIHITINRDILMAGLNDTFSGQGKMSDKDVQGTLAAMDEQVGILTQAANNKKFADEQAYFDGFATHSDVKKTAAGLLYQINNKGEGAAIKDTDLVEVHYEGALKDGTVVDGADNKDATQLFRVENMPPVLRDGIKLLRKGGQITIVIPPSPVKNVTGSKTSKQDNAVLIYTLSLTDVKTPG